MSLSYNASGIKFFCTSVAVCKGGCSNCIVLNITPEQFWLLATGYCGRTTSGSWAIDQWNLRVTDCWKLGILQCMFLVNESSFDVWPLLLPYQAIQWSLMSWHQMQWNLKANDYKTIAACYGYRKPAAASVPNFLNWSCLLTMSYMLGTCARVNPRTQVCKSVWGNLEKEVGNWGKLLHAHLSLCFHLLELLTQESATVDVATISWALSTTVLQCQLWQQQGTCSRTLDHFMQSKASHDLIRHCAVHMHIRKMQRCSHTAVKMSFWHMLPDWFQHHTHMLT